MSTLLRALIVEDSESDALLMVRLLERNGYDVEFERVQTAATMADALKSRSWDIVIADHAMPEFSAPMALNVLTEHGGDIPFIIVSGRISAEMAVRLLKDGADDWVNKDDLSRLVPAIDRELRDAATRREKERVERGLRDSEERFRSIVETTKEWIWMIDPEGKITYSNPAVKDILGYSPEELIDVSYIELMPEDERGRERDELRNHVEAKEGWLGCISVWTHGDGSLRYLESTAVPCIDSSGALTGFQGADRDITEKRKAETELRISRDECEASAIKAQTYLDFIAHDMTNILSPIMMYSEMISTDPTSSPWVRDTAGKVVRQIERAAAFVRNTRRLSGSETDSREKCEIADLRQIIEAKEGDLRNRHANKRLEFDHSLPPDAGIGAVGGCYVQDIVDEVLENAVKHSGKDAVKIWVRISPAGKSDSNRYWRVEISDNGPGIPDDAKRGLMVEVFEPENRMRRGIATSLPFLSLVAEHIGGMLRIEDRVPGDQTQGTKIVLLFRKALVRAPPLSP
ncbi:MAG: PAS domain S-box protein [Candidatus Thermoplasmatota archaeon]